MRWVIKKKDLEDFKTQMRDYAKERLERPSADQVRKYYTGFKIDKTKKAHMYEDEIKDLEYMYRKQLIELDKSIEDLTPSFCYEMKQWMDLQNEKSMIKEKLEVLVAKKECKHD